MQRDLCGWYYEEYTKHKGYCEETAWTLAQSFAGTVLVEGHGDNYLGHLGNLRGALGETLGRAAMIYLTDPDEYGHYSTNQSLDHLGVDINVLKKKNRKPVIGLGVKLNNCARPQIKTLPSGLADLPILNIRVEPETVKINELLRRQRAGDLISPYGFIEDVFHDKGYKNTFLEMLYYRCNAALRQGIGSDFPDAVSYMRQFV